LLVLLLTRPGNTATKDQVLEELWPDLSPTAAANSLNQTLYFLRRDIDEFYDENASADYVVYESELLWLDQDLVRSDSATFLSAVSQVAGPDATLDSRLRAIGLYPGRFAPEFQYEEWSIAWREHLHASFLHVARSALLELLNRTELEHAAAIARGVLVNDPEAAEFERDLVWLYAALGARDAADRQYVHYAHTVRNDLGTEPPTYAEVCRHHPQAVPAVQVTTSFDV
jgi:two-component SAPR family response regulator